MMSLKLKSDVVPPVENIINYHFTNRDWCWEALQGKGAGGFPHGNKRLAMLGDASMKHAQMKKWFGFNMTPEEGNLIASRDGGNEHLTTRGKELGLDHFINPNPSQKGLVSGKLIADTMEALIGAVEMDGGGEAALQEVMRTLGVL